MQNIILYLFPLNVGWKWPERVQIQSNKQRGIHMILLLPPIIKNMNNSYKQRLVYSGWIRSPVVKRSQHFK